MFEDQIEQLKEIFESIKERIQESSLYLTLYERYSLLSPRVQKITLIGLGVFIAFILTSPPLAQYHTSRENIADFENRKNITQKIIQQAKTSGGRTKTPKEITKQDLERTLKNFAKSPVINLTEDQATVMFNRNQSSKVVPQAQQEYFKIVGKDFNAEQTLNLAYSLKRLNSSLLITQLTFKESTMRPGYFDNEINITNVYVPPATSILPTQQDEVDDKPTRRRSRSKRIRQDR